MADDEQPTVSPVAAPRGTRILVGVIVATVGLASLVVGAALVAPPPLSGPVAVTGSPVIPTPSALLRTPVPPEWVVALGASLDCRGEAQAFGGELGSFEPVPGFDGPVPYPWLESVEGVALPLTGWRQDPVVPWYGEDGYVRYVHVVDRRLVAALVLSGTSTNPRRATWSVAAVRACPADEFDPASLRTTDDDPWTSPDGSSHSIAVSRGDARCGRDGVIVLRIGDRAYVRDPGGALPPGALVGNFEPTSSPPRDATLVARASADRELLTSGTDPEAVWIRAHTAVERWPRAIGEIGCT